MGEASPWPPMDSAVRNLGRATLPQGVEVEVRNVTTGQSLGVVQTTAALISGQTEVIELPVAEAMGGLEDAYAAELAGEAFATAKDCRGSNDVSPPTSPSCNIAG